MLAHSGNADTHLNKHRTILAVANYIAKRDKEREVRACKFKSKTEGKKRQELACPTEASGTQGSKAQASSKTMLAHVTVRPKKKLKSTHLMKKNLNTYKELMIHLINSHGLPSTLVESPQLRTLVQFLISKGTILSQFPPEELHIERRKVEIISRLQIK
jgi:hypothetical protein